MISTRFGRLGVSVAEEPTGDSRRFGQGPKRSDREDSLTNHRKGDNLGIGNSGCSTITEGSPNCAAGRGDETRAAMDPNPPKPDVSSLHRSPAPNTSAGDMGDGSNHPPQFFDTATPPDRAPLLEDRLSTVRENYRAKLHLDREAVAAEPGTCGAAKSGTTVTASSICHQAGDLVGGDRAAAYGDTSINFKNIADAWNALLRSKFRRDGSPDAGFPSHLLLTALDVASMMEALKIARRYSGAHNPDDYVDGAGYAAVAGEIAAGEIGSME